VDQTAQAILVGAISGGVVAVLGAIGVFIINQRASKSTAKKSDLALLEESYNHLQQTTESSNDRLNNMLEAERLARQKDRNECERQIDTLRMQVIELTRKLPEPGAVVPVLIAGIDTAALPALPVMLTAVQEDVILPTEIKRPIPVPMTAAQAIAAAAEGKSKAPDA
jgi:hypothetical protein